MSNLFVTRNGVVHIYPRRRDTERRGSSLAGKLSVIVGSVNISESAWHSHQSNESGAILDALSIAEKSDLPNSCNEQKINPVSKIVLIINYLRFRIDLLCLCIFISILLLQLIYIHPDIFRNSRIDFNN